MKRMMILLAGLLLLPAVPTLAGEDGYTTEFDIEECSFSDRGRNAYWSLNPVDQLILEGFDEDEGEVFRVEITVLRDRQWISFETTDGERVNVHSRVIEEREWLGEDLVEVSRNFFARCRQTNDIFYFGEDVDIYEDGIIVSHDGAWRAGFDEAQPGLIMPGRFLLGSRYFQEVAPDEAMDRAEHVESGLTIETDAGEFDECVAVVETTPLEPDEESIKVYCEGVGLVIDDEAELVEYNIRDEPEHDADVRTRQLATPLRR